VQPTELVKHAGVLWQHKREFARFLEFLESQGVKSVLEIGTGMGGSAWCFGCITDNGRVVTVDDGSVVKAEQRRAQSNPNFVQVFGRADTLETEMLVASYGPFDLVYFDGEHDYESTVAHHQRYVKYANRFVAQHDINLDEEGWSKREPQLAGIVKGWRELTAGKIVWDFISPDPDPRFPRWGGIGVFAV
jgi:hypothetical protein